jgi:hypothetical protein
MQQRFVTISIDEDSAPADHQQQQWGRGEAAEAPYSSSSAGNQQPQLTPTAAAKAPATARDTTKPPTAAAAAAAAAARVSQAAAQQLQLHEPIGQGTFGVVFRATWRGIPSAVKLMQLPAAVGESLESAGLAGAGAGGRGSSSREQMAVMEAAVGASINHPNVVQVRHRVLGRLLDDSLLGQLLHSSLCGYPSAYQGRRTAQENQCVTPDRKPVCL